MLIVRNATRSTWKITQDRRFTTENSWELRLEENTADGEAVAAAARGWAGKIGDPFRLPTEKGDFVFSDEWFVTSIVFNPVDLATVRVIFSAERLTGIAESVGDITETHDSEGTRTRSGTWRIDAAAGRDAIPAAGQALEWDGGMFVCENCRIRELDGRAVEFSITGREVSHCVLGEVVFSRDDDGIRTARQEHFIGVADAEAFLAELADGAPAPWAGDGFYLGRTESRSRGLIGLTVTLEAREVSTRQLTAVRNEVFAGFDHAGVARREIVWNVVHQVLAADLTTYYGLVGSDGSAWTESYCIVTRVSPQRRSAVEYRVEIEVQHRGNPSLQVQTGEDNSGLDMRREFAVDLTEFYVSAEMAGYQYGPGGAPLPILHWRAAEQCPFQSGGVLAVNMAESTLRTLTITETSYLPGGVAENMAELAEWGVIRIQNTPVAGRAGSFLRARQSGAELLDDTGKIYTRLRRTFLLAPGAFLWNATYWNNH